jgi:hypothetical protein
MASQRQRRAILGVVAAGFIHWAVVADIAGGNATSLSA